MNTIRSSIKLETETKRNLEVIWLINKPSPDHGTISNFVKVSKESLQKILKELSLILKGWGSIDGKNLKNIQKAKTIVEHPFRAIKRNLNYIYFNRHGLDSVNAEAASIFIDYNLKRIINILIVLVIIEKLKQL